MAAYSWAKIYIEVLDDPKMGRLPDSLWRRVIELILLAKRHGIDGELPPIENIAWSLRIDKDRLLSDLQELANPGIEITTLESGKWKVTHFAERQDRADVSERVGEHRERKKKSEYYGNETLPNDVTKGYTDTDTETDTDTKLRKKSARQIALSELETYFSDMTKLPLPPRKSEKDCKSSADSWWQPLGALYELTGKDVGDTKAIIKEAIDHMAKTGMTIAAPRSIEKTARSKWAEGKRAEDKRTTTKVYS